MAKTRRPYKTEYFLFSKSLNTEYKEIFSRLCDFYYSKYLLELNDRKIQKFLSDSYRSNVRTPVEYLYDLNEGWLFEDFIQTFLAQQGVSLKSTRRDESREVVNSSGTYNSPDFEILINEEYYQLQYKFARFMFPEFNIKPSSSDSYDKYFVLFHILSKNQFFIFNPRIHGKKFPIFSNKKWKGKMYYRIPTLKLEEDLPLFNLEDLIENLQIARRNNDEQA
jgi:hypothetical protein